LPDCGANIVTFSDYTVRFLAKFSIY